MTDRRALVALALLHAAIVALVMPRGDFPLNDDWAYAQGVSWLIAEGRIRLSDWAGMNLVPQTLLGAAAVAVLGPGFETLRHVTQAAALAAMGACYAWLRAARLEPWPALVATAAVVSLPVWDVLANSFMSDLYGLALFLGAAACFARALRTGSDRMLAAATVLVVIGVLQRQVCLAIAFAYMVAALWTRAKPGWKAVLRAVLPFALALATEAAFHAYLAAGPGVPSGQRMLHGRLVPMAVATLTDARQFAWAASNAVSIAGYLGLFSVGWFAWWGMRGASAGTRIVIAAGGALIACAALAASWLAPYRPDNVMDAAGIGPFMLYDHVRGLAPLDRAPGLFWRLVAIPAAFATAGLAALAIAALARIARAGRAADPVHLLALATLVAYLGPFVVTDFGDRYLAYALPFVFVLWAGVFDGAQPAPAWQRGVALAWIAVALLLGAAATRDYFAWNRARWDALRDLERGGATAEAIDGGFEYNALRRFRSSDVRSPAGKSWYWVNDDRYVVALGPIAGYREVRSTPVAHWLPRSPARIVVLERNP
jgi:hypothetical protein